MSIAVSKGTGSHETTLSGPEAAMKAGYWSFIAFEIGTFSFGLPKIAIALLLGRMLPLRREVYWLLVSLAGLLTLYAIGQDIVYIEQCTPTEGLWNKSIKSTCWDRRPVIISGTAFGGKSLPVLECVGSSEARMLSCYQRFPRLLTCSMPFSRSHSC